MASPGSVAPPGAGAAASFGTDSSSGRITNFSAVFSWRSMTSGAISMGPSSVSTSERRQPGQWR